MKRMAKIFALVFFARAFAESDSIFTFNAVTFSEHYPRFELEDFDSLPEWYDSECALTYESDWYAICMERFTYDGGGAYFSRVDSSVGIIHTFVTADGDEDDYYPSWQFWRVGYEAKLPITSVIIDEFKMYHECGYLKMPWAEADSIIRRIVFEFMLSGDTTVDWMSGDYYNASGLSHRASFVIPGAEKKNPVELSPVSSIFLPTSVSSLMRTTALLPAKSLSSFRISKISPNRFSIDRLNAGTPYRIFDLNGNLLQRETWQGGAIIVNRIPAVLHVQGKAYLLR